MMAMAVTSEAWLKNDPKLPDDEDLVLEGIQELRLHTFPHDKLDACRKETQIP